uniref:Uncharacterized protein n=1 Tax=Anguilla anguilla TaxID=7936 RepID=A0A0E9T6I0_ANGAN
MGRVGGLGSYCGLDWRPWNGLSISTVSDSLNSKPQLRKLIAIAGKSSVNRVFT